jgi:hypothetical protein
VWIVALRVSNVNSTSSTSEPRAICALPAHKQKRKPWVSWALSTAGCSWHMLATLNHNSWSIIDQLRVRVRAILPMFCFVRQDFVDKQTVKGREMSGRGWRMSCRKEVVGYDLIQAVKRCALLAFPAEAWERSRQTPLFEKANDMSPSVWFLDEAILKSLWAGLGPQACGPSCMAPSRSTKGSAAPSPCDVHAAACSECFTNHKLAFICCRRAGGCCDTYCISGLRHTASDENFLDSEIVRPLRTDQGDA